MEHATTEPEKPARGGMLLIGNLLDGAYNGLVDLFSGGLTEGGRKDDSVAVKILALHILCHNCPCSM